MFCFRCECRFVEAEALLDSEEMRFVCRSTAGEEICSTVIAARRGCGFIAGEAGEAARVDTQRANGDGATTLKE